MVRYFQVIKMLFTQVKPMLLSSQNEAFDDENFIFEPKWDGWRIIIHKQGDRVEAYTKNGHGVTEQFPELWHAVKGIHSHTAILDCEGVSIKDGRPNFDDFSYRGRLKDKLKIQTAAAKYPVTFIPFDVLYTSKDHTSEPLMDRRIRLEEIITPNEFMMPTMSIEGKGKQLKQLTIEKDLEGIVAKRRDSKYLTDSRSNDWIKIKNYKLIDTVILGYRTEPHFQLVVGVHFRTVPNKPVAIVECGIKPEEKKAFLEIAKQLHVRKEKHTQWIEPRLCCRIQYQDRTDTHHLRNTSFKGVFIR
jgi:bifunctional non-homologous end joining protein LigD